MCVLPLTKTWLCLFAVASLSVWNMLPAVLHLADDHVCLQICLILAVKCSTPTRYSLNQIKPSTSSQVYHRVTASRSGCGGEDFSRCIWLFVVYYIRRTKWSWFGHMLRREGWQHCQHYSGYCKAMEDECNVIMPGKEIWSKKCELQASVTACGRWRLQREIELDADKWCVECAVLWATRRKTSLTLYFGFWYMAVRTSAVFTYHFMALLMLCVGLWGTTVWVSWYVYVSCW